MPIPPINEDLGIVPPDDDQGGAGIQERIIQPFVPPFNVPPSIPVAGIIQQNDALRPLGGNVVLNQSGIAQDVIHPYAQPDGWFELAHEPYSERWTAEDGAVVRYFNGPWNTRKIMIDWLLGYAFTVKIANMVALPGGQKVAVIQQGPVNLLVQQPPNPGPTDPDHKLRRHSPAQHPEYPWLYCTEVDDVHGVGEGVVNNAPMRDFQGNLIYDINGRQQYVPMIGYLDNSPNGVGDRLSCVLKATYRPLPYEVRSDAEMDFNAGLTELHRHVERKDTYAFQSISAPVGQLKFVDPANHGQPQPLAQAQNIIVLTRELTYIWNQVPDVPEDGIAACAGCVNSVPFDAPVTLANGATLTFNGKGFAPETLLFIGVNKERIPRSVTGRLNWRISYKFLWREHGWNAYPRIQNDTVVWQRVTSNGTQNGAAYYPVADYNQLFAPPSPQNYQSEDG